MDSTFQKPTGINFHCTDDAALAALSRTLCRVCSVIQDFDQPAVLGRYDDWWEHDGLHFFRGSLDMHGLFGLVESPQSLLEAMQGDDNVFVGVAPLDNSWYLRFYVHWDDEGQELLGRFDITIPAGLLQRFKESILGDIEVKIEQSDSDVYYSSIQR